MHPLHWECSEKKLTQFWEPSNLSFVAFNLFTIFKVIYTEEYSAADVNFQKKNGNKKKTDKTCPLNIDTSMADIAVKPSSAAYTVSFLCHNNCRLPTASQQSWKEIKKVSHRKLVTLPHSSHALTCSLLLQQTIANPTSLNKQHPKRWSVPFLHH